MRCCPLATLIDQGVAQADPGAQIEEMVRAESTIRAAARSQQLAQAPRVGAVGLGALLVAAPRRGLRRLGEVNVGADRA